MLCHTLKKIIIEAKGCPNKARVDAIDGLWLKAQNLLSEAKQELDVALQRLSSGDKIGAYSAVLRANSILSALDET